MAKVGDLYNEKGEEIYKWIECTDKGHVNPSQKSFYFTVRERDFYAEKGFGEPIRCHTCRLRKRQQRDLEDQEKQQRDGDVTTFRQDSLKRDQQSRHENSQFND